MRMKPGRVALAFFLLGCSSVGPREKRTGATEPRAPQAAATPAAAPASAPDAASPSLPFSPATALSRLETASIVGRVGSFYAAPFPFECDFAIETVRRPSDLPETSRMHLVFAEPGRFHASFSTGEVMVGDGHDWETIHPTGAMVIHVVPKIPPVHCPIGQAYFCGAHELIERFSFVAYPGATIDAPGMDVLVGEKRRFREEKLLLFVEATGEVKRSVVVDASGNRQRFDTLGCTMRTPAPPPALFKRQSRPPPPSTSASTPSRPVRPLIGLP
jgi:hypothetical protein